MLVRTPHHKPTESLLGYVLRISESNGYETPWHVLAHAGFSQGEMRTAGLSVEKLSAILGKPADALSEIAYRGFDETGSREFRLLGHSLGKGLNYDPLRLAKPAICPHCIVENGHIDAFFDLNVAVACPVHRCKLTDHCLSCGHELSWFRPGMLTCKCGASLAEAPMDPVSPELANLMAAVWAVLRRTPVVDFPENTGLPVLQLLGTPLRALALKLPDLGGFQLRATGAAKSDPDSLELLNGAALALTNWPQGFHEFLAHLAQVDERPIATTFGKRYEHFRKKFFSKRPCGADFVWLRDEFVRYGLGAWGDSAIDKKMIRGEQRQARYITKSELAQRLNVTHTTLLAWSQQGRVKLKKVQTATQPRYIADAEDEDLKAPISAEGAVFDKREAAAYLGLPVSVLGRLKATGHFPVRHQAKQKQAFHQADLDSFRLQLLVLATPGSAETSDIPPTALVDLAFTLRKYRFHDHDRKAEFVVAYLAGRITPVYRTGDKLSDIKLRKSVVEAFVSGSRSGAAGNSLSQHEAAALIGCGFVALPTLLSRGLLVAEEGREGLRITRASITEFGKMYAAIACLAGELNTSARRLLRLCEIGAIPLMQVARSNGSPISFINRGEVASLQRLSHEYPARKPKGETENQALAAVRLYLAELQTSGARLPRRAGLPNKKAIARACCFNRDVLYDNAAVLKQLTDYARNELDVRVLSRVT